MSSKSAFCAKLGELRNLVKSSQIEGLINTSGWLK